MTALIDTGGVAGVSAVADDGGESANYSPDRNLDLAQLSVHENGCTEGAQRRATIDIVNSVEGVSNSTTSNLISNSSVSYLDGVDEDTAIMLRFLLKTISQTIMSEGPLTNCELLTSRARNLIALLENSLNRRLSDSNAGLKLSGVSSQFSSSMDSIGSLGVEQTDRLESDEASLGEEEGKNTRSREGNSTVALADEEIGEVKEGTIKESTINSVLDVLTNYLPHELSLQMAAVVGDFLVHPVIDTYADDESQHLGGAINEVSNSLDELRVREFLSGSALGATSMANMTFDSPTKPISLTQSNSWFSAGSPSSEQLSLNISSSSGQITPPRDSASSFSLATSPSDTSRDINGSGHQSPEATRAERAVNSLSSERRNDFLKFRLVLEKGTGVPVLKFNDNGGRRKCCLQYFCKDNTIRWRSSRLLSPGEKVRCDKIVRVQRDDKVLHIWHMISSTHGFIRKMVAFEAKSIANARILYNAFVYMQDNSNVWKETTLTEK
eukprot:366057_1